MAQNIYDTPSFFAGYSTLPRSRDGLDGMPEWDSLRALLPSIDSQTHVLDLGCGYGWFARWARDQGARSVTGLEISEKMIAKAEELGRSAETEKGALLKIRYVRQDLETVELGGWGFEGWGLGGRKSEVYGKRGDREGEERYGLVASQLALHYVVDVERLLGQVYEVLEPGGKFVFSVEHPIFTAPTTTKPRWIPLPNSSTIGEAQGEGGKEGEGKKAWPLEGYAREGPRQREWFGEKVVKQHRTIGTWVRLLYLAGFVIETLEEWVPTQEQIDMDKGEDASLETLLDRPIFLLVKVGKPHDRD